jgi:hypothetical protein
MGATVIIEDRHAVLTAATRIALHYVGPEKADEYGRVNGGDSMMAVRTTPVDTGSEDNVTDISGVTAGRG